MDYFRKGPLFVLSRVIGFAAAYALLLNLIFVGLLGAKNANASTTHGVGTFELCLNGDIGTTPHPDDGSQHTGKVHCALCAAGTAFAVHPAHLPVVIAAIRITHAVLKPVTKDVAPSSVDRRGASPRGPPQQA